MTSTNCHVVVPVYRPLTPVETIVVSNNARMLRDYPFVVIGPKGAREALSQAETLIRAAGSEARVQPFPDRDFAGISGYNALLKTRRFLDSFDGADFILICQTDAVILDDDLGRWLASGYDFVGAPHFVGYKELSLPVRFAKGANGGLSLRNLRAARVALDRVNILPRTLLAKSVVRTGLAALSARTLGTKMCIIPKPNLNEDVLWSVEIPGCDPDFRVAPPEVAAGFAFEVLPRHLMELRGGRLPFGCHAWQRYDQEFWLGVFPRKLSDDLRRAIAET